MKGLVGLYNELKESKNPIEFRTPNVEYSQVYPGGTTTYQLITPDQSNIMGFTHDVDFPGEPKEKTRGEVMILSVRGEKGKGMGTSLMLDALNLMWHFGARTVKFTVPSREGKPFNDALERKGYIKFMRDDGRTGTSEYKIMPAAIYD